MTSYFSTLFLVLLFVVHVAADTQYDQVAADDDDKAYGGGSYPNRNLITGRTWAVLVAGSYGISNYRHQADICHAYQILKKGGLKDENIIVFMYDDIAGSKDNPRPGLIFNRPGGEDVYAGVPKDYTGQYATAQNFYAVLLGNKAGVSGGSRKVVASKPNDRIFIYYSDHGGPGVLTMPNQPNVFANDFINVLKKKYASRTYKEMVIYVEACDAGSTFEGLLPENMNIYAMTASNAKENSWAAYCDNPGFNGICFGDLYSVAWLEHSESHNRRITKLQEQYDAVKLRTAPNNTFPYGSHVTEYGTKRINGEILGLFQGFQHNVRSSLFQAETHPESNAESSHAHVRAEDADLHFLWSKYKASNDGSQRKLKFLKQLTEEVRHRNQLDASVGLVGMLLFGPSKHHSVLNSSRAPGLPLVDDWQCHKSMIRLFETHCGSLGRYGLKHARAFANFCNHGVSEDAMEEASAAACSGHDMGKWDPKIIGYTA